MTQSSCTIRRAARGDLETLGHMGALLLRLHYEFDRDRFMSPMAGADKGYGAFLGSQLGESDALVLVAERDAEVVGYLYAGIEPRNWKELREQAGFIHDLYVAEGHRSQGVGDALMIGAFEWMREQRMPRVLLWTAAPNEHARRVFERLGFRSTMTEMTKELD